MRVDVVPPPPANSKQPGVTKSLLYNGSRFQGSQKSKGNSYDVEVVLQVSFSSFPPFYTMFLNVDTSDIAPQIEECAPLSRWAWEFPTMITCE